MKKILVSIILLLLLGACASPVVFGPKDLDKNLTNDSYIRRGVLENGLRYIMRVNRIPEKRAELQSFRVWAEST